MDYWTTHVTHENPRLSPKAPLRGVPTPYRDKKGLLGQKSTIKAKQRMYLCRFSHIRGSSNTTTRQKGTIRTKMDYRGKATYELGSSSRHPRVIQRHIGTIGKKKGLSAKNGLLDHPCDSWEPTVEPQRAPKMRGA
ncbi:hypothetical protein COLO4_17777 [Corchorus olitorius]|uniref:Uncharacterized protein n=1 Tax=Corchorus olitorius TaxID=93759 RepID=A0A1R3JBG7_9ROSI|nr:hypothetical protein COLO4_17777 [Corchorus olitorius]